MKTLFWVIILVSIGVLIFSIVKGAEAKRRSRLTSIHDTVKVVSLAYFGSCAILFEILRRKSVRRKSVKWVQRTSQLAVFVCVVMGIWSLALSRQVSFDEVYQAWVTASVILAGIAFQHLKAAKPPIEPGEKATPD